MTGKIVGLSQAFPFPGKLNAVSNVAEKDAEIVNQELDDAENELIKKVTQAYNELRFIRKAIEVTGKSKKLLNDIAENVRRKYEVSTASQQNILKVELEITNLNDKLEDLKSKENSIISTLNSLLLRDTETNIYTGKLDSVQYYHFTVAELDSIAKQHRAYLKGISEAEAKAALQKSLAEYDYLPNFNVSVQYSQRDRIEKTNTPLNDFFSVMVGISLPLNYGGKVTAKVEEAESMQELYNRQYDLAMQVLNENFGTSISKLNSLEERIKLIEQGLYPQAEQTLSSALSSYQVGQIDFINVIDAQNKVFQIETNLYRLKTDYINEIVNIEFLTGYRFKNKSLGE